MEGKALAGSVLGWVDQFHALTDEQLELEWQWGAYSEGLRHAFLRTHEELLLLAARLGSLRASSAYIITTAQHLLGQYHLAYRDFQAVLLGADDPQAEQEVAGEGRLRELAAHVVQAERGFYTFTHYGLAGHRTQDGRGPEMTEAIWDSYWADQPFKEISEGPLSGVMAYYENLHALILVQMETITDAELDLEVHFWDGPMPVHFRLVRFTSHLRQHTIHAEKLLAKQGGSLSEARRLARLLYGALAQVEANILGTPDVGRTERQELADQIAARAEQVGRIAAGQPRQG